MFVGRWGGSLLKKIFNTASPVMADNTVAKF